MELNNLIGRFIKGYEKMWNNRSVRFLWEVIGETDGGISVKSFVLADSKNVKKQQLPLGYSFNKGINKKYLTKLIDSGEAEVISLTQSICSKCNLLNEYGCKSGECMLEK